MHFIQRKQFSKTNVTSHAFQQISGLKIFPECFRGPLKTLWRATCGRQACSWTTLMYLMQDRNIYLYSCIACESQSFKRVFYLIQIFVITGGPLERRARGNCPIAPPLNLDLSTSNYIHEEEGKYIIICVNWYQMFATNISNSSQSITNFFSCVQARKAVNKFFAI